MKKKLVFNICYILCIISFFFFFFKDFKKTYRNDHFSEKYYKQTPVFFPVLPGNFPISISYIGHLVHIGLVQGVDKNTGYSLSARLGI
jgi:hypothetical protein